METAFLPCSVACSFVQAPVGTKAPVKYLLQWNLSKLVNSKEQHLFMHNYQHNINSKRHGAPVPRKVASCHHSKLDHSKSTACFTAKKALKGCHKKPHKPCAVSDGKWMVLLTLFHREKQVTLLLTMHVSSVNKMEMASMQCALVQA